MYYRAEENKLVVALKDVVTLNKKPITIEELNTLLKQEELLIAVKKRLEVFLFSLEEIYIMKINKRCW